MSYDIDFPYLLRNQPDDSGSNWYGASLNKGDKQNRRDYGIYVGTGGHLSVVPINKELYGGNIVTFKNIPDGTFLPILAARIAWDSVTFLEEEDSLTFTGSPAVTAPDGAYEVSSGLTTSGDGDVVGMVLEITVASNAVTAVSVKKGDKASWDGFTTSDTITIPANWYKGTSGASFNVTTTSATTSQATTCSDLCIFSK